MSKRGIKNIEVKRTARIELDEDDIQELIELLDFARVELNRCPARISKEKRKRLQGTLDQYFQELD